jgi:hypothetical protein
MKNVVLLEVAGGAWDVKNCSVSCRHGVCVRSGSDSDLDFDVCTMGGMYDMHYWREEYQVMFVIEMRYKVRFGCAFEVRYEMCENRSGESLGRLNPRISSCFMFLALGSIVSSGSTGRCSLCLCVCVCIYMTPTWCLF